MKIIHMRIPLSFYAPSDLMHSLGYGIGIMEGYGSMQKIIVLTLASSTLRPKYVAVNYLTLKYT